MNNNHVCQKGKLSSTKASLCFDSVIWYDIKVSHQTCRWTEVGPLFVKQDVSKSERVTQVTTDIYKKKSVQCLPSECNARNESDSAVLPACTVSFHLIERIMWCFFRSVGCLKAIWQNRNRRWKYDLISEPFDLLLSPLELESGIQRSQWPNDANNTEG